MNEKENTISVKDFYVENCQLVCRTGSVSPVSMDGVRMNGYAVIPIERYVELLIAEQPFANAEDIKRSVLFPGWEERIAASAKEHNELND